MQRRVIYEQLSYYMSTVHAVHEGGMRGVVWHHVPPPAVKTKPTKLHNDIGIYSIHAYIHNPQSLLIAGLDKTQFDLLKFEFADMNGLFHP